MSKPKSVLVIEDHKALRVLICGILKKEFSVIAKKNGLEAMAYLASGNIPDLILLDVEMPEMDGFELIKNLKCSGFYREIPIIVVSGNNDDITRKTCYDLGVKYFFKKPFKPQELISKINSVTEIQSAFRLAS